MAYLQRVWCHLLRIWSYRRPVLTVSVFCFLLFCSYKTIQFFNTYEVSFQSPIIFQNPVVLNYRQQTVFYQLFADANVNPLSEDQQYVCNKFGKDCRVALAIFRAESGLSPNAISVNKDGSVDFGCMQINSIHLKNIDTSHVNLLNCRDNIDVAYKIFKLHNSFTAWSAYKSGKYKQYLIN